MRWVFPCFGVFGAHVPFLLRNVFRNTWGVNRARWGTKKAILRWPWFQAGAGRGLKPVVEEQEIGVNAQFALIGVHR